ncbi:MAG: nucleotide sugar dehydrogenase [Parcubacteria group bacterium]|nr:nucleotide sugar dehydrogenase [Parcubacteria group bacterium]
MIENKTVAIVGLGYVGLPLACLCSRKGWQVEGIDINKETIASINKGVAPIAIEPGHLGEEIKKKKIKAAEDFKNIADAQVIIICVPTPVSDSYLPNLGPVKSASQSVAKYLKKGQLVVLESTVNPGVSIEVVKPILEESGLKAGKDFHLAHCPERIDPGNEKWTVINIPRVVGGINKTSAKVAKDFYEEILEGKVMMMKSLKEAEAVKIVENSFRDINIAFVNELAQSFNKMDIDIVDVINGASTKPFSFLAHYPSCGVGGHCIPVDPYYLIERAKASGFTHEFLRLAREINNYMPTFTVDLITQALNDHQKSIKGTNIGILGLAYKKNISDTRESPAYEIIDLLKKVGAELHIYDPYVKDESNASSLADVLKKSDCLVIATDHDEFKGLSVADLEKNNILAVVDGKNCLDKDSFAKSKVDYQGIGR